MVTLAKKKCKACGKIFFTEKNSRLYCDICRHIKRVCNYCGKKFHIKRWRLAEGPYTFCSLSCYNKSRASQKHDNKVEIICKNCEAIFKDWKSQNRKFCSRECADNFAKDKHRSLKTEFRKGDVPWWIKRGEPNPATLPEIKELKSRITKELWNSEDYVRKQMKSRNVRPNKAELLLERLMIERGLPFRYAGDGKKIIGGKCPDYINSNGEKQIIELFGEYWHKPEEEEERKTLFAKHGFKTLIIWYSELINNPDDVMEKITSFINEVHQK